MSSFDRPGFGVGNVLFVEVSSIQAVLIESAWLHSTFIHVHVQYLASCQIVFFHRYNALIGSGLDTTGTEESVLNIEVSSFHRLFKFALGEKYPVFGGVLNSEMAFYTIAILLCLIFFIVFTGTVINRTPLGKKKVS